MRRFYTGINAATMAFLRGHVARAREIAGDVEKLCQQALQGGSGEPADAYWSQATLAEAALRLGKTGRCPTTLCRRRGSGWYALG